MRDSLRNRQARYSTPTWIVMAVGLPVLFAIVVVERLWIDVAIVGVAGLALGLFYLWTSKVLRDAETLLEQLPYAPSPEPSEAMLAVDALDEAIHDARDVPLTDQVRLDRRRVDSLLVRLRTALSEAPAESVALLDELDTLVRRAKPVPLTDEIRLDRDEVYDILDRMRASFAERAPDFPA